MSSGVSCVTRLSQPGPASSVGTREQEATRKEWLCRLADELRASWQGGEPTDTRAFLDRYPELRADPAFIVDLAFCEYSVRRELGERLEPEEFCGRFPEHKDRLLPLVLAQHFLAERLASDAKSVLREIGQLSDSAVPSEWVRELKAVKVPSTEPAPWPQPGERFLDFQLLRLLGRGKFAHVYLATEPALGHRRVALKIAPAGDHEAATLGRLHHDHIVPVYSVQKDHAGGRTVVCMPFLGSATLQ